MQEEKVNIFARKGTIRSFEYYLFDADYMQIDWRHCYSDDTLNIDMDLQRGDYFLKVQGTYGNTGTYDLTISIE